MEPPQGALPPRCTETLVQRRQLLLSVTDGGLAPMPLEVFPLIRPGWLNDYSDAYQLLCLHWDYYVNTKYCLPQTK